MRYPGAHRGVRLLFWAQLLTVLSAIALIVAAIVVVNSKPAALENAESLDFLTATTASNVLTIVSLVVSLLAALFNLIGLICGIKDEFKFFWALLFTIGSAAASIASSFVTGNATVQFILKVAVDVLEYLVPIFIVLAILSLSKKLGHDVCKLFGRILFVLEFFLFAGDITGALILRFTGNAEVAKFYALAAPIVSLVAALMLFIYLKMAEIMLRKK